jgi:hypothetical protein
MKTMTMDLNTGSRMHLALERQQTLSTRDARGMALECLRGSLWITFEGGGDDYFLAPGERLPLHAGGKLVVQALENSEFMFLPQSPEPAISAETGNPVGGLAAYTAQCWRSFVSGLSAQRVNLEAPF